MPPVVNFFATPARRHAVRCHARLRLFCLLACAHLRLKKEAVVL